MYEVFSEVPVQMRLSHERAAGADIPDPSPKLVAENTPTFITALRTCSQEAGKRCLSPTVADRNNHYCPCYLVMPSTAARTDGKIAVAWPPRQSHPALCRRRGRCKPDWQAKNVTHVLLERFQAQPTANLSLVTFGLIHSPSTGLYVAEALLYVPHMYLGHQLSHNFYIWGILVVTMKNNEGNSYSTCKPVGL
ncbi:hypothetical protein B0H11DRAFT_2310257 [Mycena galericulata]|nr:hypothetical protein B0H11DRAFT_2310257 [Mycena galericulata]